MMQHCVMANGSLILPKINWGLLQLNFLLSWIDFELMFVGVFLNFFLHIILIFFNDSNELKLLFNFLNFQYLFVLCKNSFANKSFLCFSYSLCRFLHKSITLFVLDWWFFPSSRNKCKWRLYCNPPPQKKHLFA